MSSFGTRRIRYISYRLQQARQHRDRRRLFHHLHIHPSRRLRAHNSLWSNSWWISVLRLLSQRVGNRGILRVSRVEQNPAVRARDLHPSAHRRSRPPPPLVSPTRKFNVHSRRSSRLLLYLRGGYHHYSHPPSDRRPLAHARPRKRVGMTATMRLRRPRSMRLRFPLCYLPSCATRLAA